MECNGGIIGYGDPGQQGKCTILKLHYHAAHGGERLRNIEELQDDWLVCAQQIAPGNPKLKRVADVSGGASNGNAPSEWTWQGLIRYVVPVVSRFEWSLSRPGPSRH